MSSNETRGTEETPSTTGADAPAATGADARTEQIDDVDVTRPIESRTIEHTPQPEPERPTGPHAPAIVLGIVCLVVAGLVLAQEVGDLSVDWGDVGPLGIVAAGALLVLFGLIGLAGSRRRSSPTATSGSGR